MVTGFMVGERIILTPEQVEAEYKEIEKLNPDYTEIKIMSKLQGVVKEDIFMSWYLQIYLKRWQEERGDT